jgi:hypothetical protein
MVLTLSGDRVVAITGFPDTGIFSSFGLPRTLRRGDKERERRGSNPPMTPRIEIRP